MQDDGHRTMHELGIEQKPCYYPGDGLTNGAFIRVGDGDHKLTSYEVQILLASRGQPREDERQVPEASVDDLDPALVAGLLERLRTPDTSPFRALDDESALVTVKALVRHGDLLTNDSYRRFTDVDSRVATRELGELVRRGLLVQEGSHRWTTYRIKPEPPPLPEPVQRGGRSGRTRADRRPAILALLAERGELSRAEMAEHLGLTDGNTRKWLGIMIDEGVNSRVKWTRRCRVVCTTQGRPGVDHEANPEPVVVR